MESTAFDALTKGMGRAADRRTALKGLAAGLAGAAGLGAVRAASAAPEDEGVSAEACAVKGDRCFRNTDCCNGLKCDNGGDTSREGKCVFKNSSGGKGDFCEKDSDCKRNLVCEKKPKKSKNKCKKDRKN